MKRTIMLAVVCVLVFALLFAGCAQGTPDEMDNASDTDNSEQVDDTEDAADDMAAEDGQDDVDAEEGQGDTTVSDALTPADSYNRFLAAKSTGYDSLYAMIEEDDMLSMTIGLQLMAVAMIDLSAIDITFLSADVEASEMAASMLGISDLDITYTGGEDFQMTYTGSEGEPIVVAGQYDGATDSLTATWTSGGTQALAMEYVIYNAGYAGQYLTYSDGTASVIKVIVDGSDVGFGFSDSDALTSIYKSAPADFSFLNDCETVITVQGGVGTSLYEGETTTF